MSSGVLQRRLDETPVAVIDFETTGLSAGVDRVIEVSVVRIDPGATPRLAFDSLVNPQRRVAATEIHGITDADVRNAPRFRDIAGELAESLRGCVVASFNVYFDLPFLKLEMGAAGARHEPPHLCVMHLRPMLGLGPTCRLVQACRSHGVQYAESHVAADDARAAAELFVKYRTEAAQRGVGTFAELARLGSYKFARSFGNHPFGGAADHGLATSGKAVSRSGRSVASPLATDLVRAALASYWKALQAALFALDVADADVAALRAVRERCGLAEDQVRAVHARAYAKALTECSEGATLGEREARRLRRILASLAKLGWAPGE